MMLIGELLLSTFRKEREMRVYVPDKNRAKINEILKELYLLRQSIDFDSCTAASKLEMCDKIRGMVQTLNQEG